MQVFLVKKISGSDARQLYAMKVLKKATLKGKHCLEQRDKQIIGIVIEKSLRARVQSIFILVQLLLSSK